MCDEACALSYLLSDVLSAAEAAAQVDVEAERLAEDGIVGLLVELITDGASAHEGHTLTQTHTGAAHLLLLDDAEQPA